MSAFKQIKTIVDSNESLSGKIFDVAIQIFILISLIGFSVETLPGLTPTILEVLEITEIICVGFFSVEYLLRLWVADKRLKFVFSVYGLVDLLAILPFYVSFGIDLRSIRALRLFRILRIFKLFRFNDSVVRLKTAFDEVKNELIIFLFATSILLYLSSFGIYHFENEAQPEKFASIFHCFWWSIVTMTTVGYGDVYPVTIVGRIFTSCVMLIGIGIVAVPTGLISSALVKVRKNHNND